MPNSTDNITFAVPPRSNSSYPKADCVLVLFDMRPVGAWAPPIDDPEQRQADLSGVWSLELTGRVDSITLGDPSIKVCCTVFKFIIFVIVLILA